MSYVTEVDPAEFVTVRMSPVVAVTAAPAAFGATHRNRPPGLTAIPSDAARNSGAPASVSRATWTSFVFPAAALT